MQIDATSYYRLPPPKARHATMDEELTDILKKGPEAIHTGLQALGEARSKDHQLARLDDVTQTLGVATIAGLGALGMIKPKSSVPLWLGAASWLFAMALTPAVLHGLVRLKSGVDLDTKYINSNGELKRLFLDPNYLPLQVLPFEHRLKLAERLGIPSNHPDRPALLKDKLKQIDTQAFTWWMLIAGPATPLIAATLCDRLEGSVLDKVTQWRQNWILNRQVKPVLLSTEPKPIETAVKAFADVTMAPASDSSLVARWWQHTSNRIVQTTKLDKLPLPQMLHESDIERYEAISNHLAEYLKQVKNRQAFEKMLQTQKRALNTTLGPLERVLNQAHVKTYMPKAPYLKLLQRVKAERVAAESTLNQLTQLLHLKSISGKSIRNLTGQMDIACIERWNRLGFVSQALRHAGPKKQSQVVVNALNQGQFAEAFETMGASSKDFLLRIANDAALNRRWWQRYPILIGGALLVSSLVYVFFAIGHDFGKKPKKNGLSA